MRGVLRRLLAAQVSAHDVTFLTEGFLSAAAHGRSRVPDVEADVRSVLGRAVIAPLLEDDISDLVDVDDDIADAVTAGRSLDLLAQIHPALRETTGQLVVRCSPRCRPELEHLLAPFRDISIVVSSDEVAHLHTGAAPTTAR